MIVVWFSCGAASAVAAFLTLQQYPADKVAIVNNFVAEEDKDNRRFLKDVEAWLNHPIEVITHSQFPCGSASKVWDRERYMSGPSGASCTKYLKKLARQQWQRVNRSDWHVLGFTLDERRRYDRFVQTELPNVKPVLIDAGLTKQDCANFVVEHGIALPKVYKQGYPNANCIGCVKATSPTYWNHVRTHHYDVFIERAIQSRRLGVKLVRYKGKRIFLDELPEDATGRPLASLSVDCGIFCEEQ